jgi:hypothetical protein
MLPGGRRPACRGPPRPLFAAKRASVSQPPQNRPDPNYPPPGAFGPVSGDGGYAGGPDPAPPYAGYPGAAAGYPSGSPTSYPGAPPGYPGGAPPAGYPGAPPPPGYPGAAPAGYPGAPPPPGYPGAGVPPLMPPAGRRPDPYYDRLAPRPGCVPLRPLGVGDILDGSFAVMRRNPRATLGLSALIAVVQSAIIAGFEIVLLHQIDQLRVGSADSSISGATLLNYLSGAASILVVGAVLGALLSGMLTLIVTEDVLGVRLTIGEVWARVRPRFWRLLGLSVLVSLAEGVGLVLCIAPGVWLWGIWAVAVPALMVEPTSIRQALRRSKQLVDGMFWRVWGIRALGVVLVGVVGNLVGLPFTVLALAVSGRSFGDLFGSGADSAVPASYVLITALGSVLSLTITAPVRAAIDALLYVDLRMRKEGLDIVLQQAASQHR